LPEGLAHLSKVHLGECGQPTAAFTRAASKWQHARLKNTLSGNRHHGLLREVEALLKLSLSQLH